MVRPPRLKWSKTKSHCAMFERAQRYVRCFNASPSLRSLANFVEWKRISVEHSVEFSSRVNIIASLSPRDLFFVVCDWMEKNFITLLSGEKRRVKREEEEASTANFLLSNLTFRLCKNLDELKCKTQFQLQLEIGIRSNTSANWIGSAAASKYGSHVCIEKNKKSKCSKCCLSVLLRVCR